MCVCVYVVCVCVCVCSVHTDMDLDAAPSGPLAPGVQDPRMAALEAGVTRALRSNRPLLLSQLPNGGMCDPPSALDNRVSGALCTHTQTHTRACTHTRVNAFLFTVHSTCRPWRCCCSRGHVYVCVCVCHSCSRCWQESTSGPSLLPQSTISTHPHHHPLRHRRGK